MKKLLAFILTLVMLLGALVCLPMQVSAVSTSESGWDGTTATKPSGSGTENDPYLVSGAANLLWMAQQIGTGGDGGSKKLLEGYFKQTANIDLNGKTLPSIGYYTNTTSFPIVAGNNIQAFSGTYDGAGYKISNGYVGYTSLDRDNHAWGTGLFGVIYGATVKNVTLSDIHLHTSAKKISVAGLVVGIAVGNTTPDADFNQILNCKVDGNCNLKPNTASGRSTDSQAPTYYRWGAVVGIACDTTVKNCTNAATVRVNGAIGVVGGIVGSMSGGVIEDCVNSGMIRVAAMDTSSKTRAGNRYYGGILGNIPDDAVKTPAIGVTVKNCYNKGNILAKDSNDEGTLAAGTVNAYFGGILGGTMANKAEYIVENCYNKGIITDIGGLTNAKFGSVVGNDASASLTVKNCYSVDVNGDTADVYCNGIAAEKISDCSTKGADMIDSMAQNMLDMSLDCALYVQKHDDGGKYRFVATIDGYEWKDGGFTVTLINSQNKRASYTESVTKCYESIVADGDPIADGEGRLFIAIILSGVDINDIVSYEISAFVTDDNGTYYSDVAAKEFSLID